MSYFQFLKTNFRWLIAGALLTAASTFGQTYFIALFGGEIRQAFSLSHGDFGFIYMGATLASAFTLVYMGQLADVMRLKTLGLLTIVGLAAGCALMGFANSLVWLALAIFMLRLFGQGMMGHVAMTAMARWFNAHRGRALSVASLGHSVGEAIVPSLAILSVVYFGWRETWMISAGVLLVGLGSVFYFFTRKERAVGTIEASSTDEDNTASWTRRQVMRDGLFYMILPGMLAIAFIATVTFFHQAHLVETKGWNITVWASFFPGFAGAAIVVSLIVGWAVDKWSARQLLPYYLLPVAGAMFVFAFGGSQWNGLLGMVLIGSTVGAAQTISSAIWAELYGTAHLGAIKALTSAAMVFSTAVGPGLTGYLMDNGIAFESILLALAAYALVSCLVFGVLQPKLMRQRKPLDV